jgi:hypothetical protein
MLAKAYGAVTLPGMHARSFVHAVYQIRSYGIPRLSAREAKDAGNDREREKILTHFRSGDNPGLCIITFPGQRVRNSRNGGWHKSSKTLFLESKIKCSQGMN